jgi:bifunctional non-homologous end joining protein LigD
MNIRPMLARLETPEWLKTVSGNPEWVFQVKYDGDRAIVDTKSGKIQSRSGKDKTANFPEIVPKTLKPCILDGEIVAYKNGKTDFNSIQHRSTSSDIQFRMAEYPAAYEVFDILDLDGTDVSGYALSYRMKLLQAVLVPDATVHLAPYTTDGELAFQNATANQLEGIMCKNLNTRYQQDRREWVKVKLSQTDHFLVCGYTKGTGWRASTFGALVLGKMTDNGLVYVGEVGTGFNDMQIDQIITTLRLSINSLCPFAANPYTFSQMPTWVTPAMTVIVKFLEYTNSGMLRFPAFKGVV